jgi:Cu2+-exporting ATPase
MIHLLGILLFSGSLGAVYTAKRAVGDKAKPTGVPGIEQPSDSVPVPQDLQALVPTKTAKAATVAEEEAVVDHYLKVSGVGLGLAAIGHLLYFPVGLFSLPVLGYTTMVIFEDAYKGLRAKQLCISLLDATAVCVGVGAGLYALSALEGLLYFAAIKTLYQTRNKTKKKLTDIFSGRPPVVWLLKDGVEIQVSLEQIYKGDRIVVNTGETIPIDGVIENGIAGIDQHILTGEAQPEEKTVGQQVFATTWVISGRITVCVEQTGADTVAAHITKILDNTDDFVSTLQTRGELLANRSVVPTIGIAGLSLLTTGPVAMGVVLSSNFSEVMRFAMPLTMLNYLHIASNAGLLIKDGRSLEQLPKVDTVVFDKTGTLTMEQPRIGMIYPGEGFTDHEVLYYTAAAEYRQSHPIAKAILETALRHGVELPTIDDAQYQIGYGICVNLDGKKVQVGSRRFMLQENISLPPNLENVEQTAHVQGHSLIYTALDNVFCGVVELRPTVRPEASEVVRRLQQRGLKVYILSGDHEGPVKTLADELGMDAYIAETLPEDKSRIIEELQQSGKTVCFVGDGINDSIAMKTAAVSVSLQDASQVAMDSAQIVLMGKNLSQLLSVFDVANRFDNHQKLAVGATVAAPSLLCMGGAMFLGFTVANSLVFYIASVIMGAGSSMLPLVMKRLESSKYIGLEGYTDKAPLSIG